jgi:methylmalonyl-CoA mutase
MAVLIDAFYAGATLEAVTAALRADEEPEQAIRLIAPHRFAEQFEFLRRKTEKYTADTEKTIKVFLANMGKIPQHKARAEFSTGFMEVGGFEVLKNDGFPTVEEAAEAAVQSGADVTVICSTDATYPELVPPLARSIKAAKPEMLIFLAGAPAAEYEASYREAGVDDFIHVRANCYGLLTWLQKERGIV